MVILLCVSQAVKALYTRDNNTPRKYGLRLHIDTLRHSGATTILTDGMDWAAKSHPAPLSRTLVSCLGRHRPYAANVDSIKRVRLKTRSIAEEVIGLAFFFSHSSAKTIEKCIDLALLSRFEC